MKEKTVRKRELTMMVVKNIEGNREKRESNRRPTLLFSFFFRLKMIARPYLAERVTGDLLRQALVEEDTAVLFCSCVVVEKRERR